MDDDAYDDDSSNLSDGEGEMATLAAEFWWHLR
jgi:hypothetical protein